MKKYLIKSLVEELGNEGYNIEGLVREGGIWCGMCGIIKWWEFDDVEDDKLKDTLIDIIKEIEEEKVN